MKEWEVRATRLQIGISTGKSGSNYDQREKREEMRKWEVGEDGRTTAGANVLFRKA